MFLTTDQKEEGAYLEILAILKLARVLRLNQLFQFLSVETDIKASMKLGKMIFFLIVYIHLYACLWWLMVKNDKSWVPYADEEKADPFMVYGAQISYKYVYSLLTAMQVTLGGDVGPRNSY